MTLHSNHSREEWLLLAGYFQGLITTTRFDFPDNDRNMLRHAALLILEALEVEPIIPGVIEPKAE